MNFRGRREGNEPDVNITPLIDVVFLLLIFFMVSTTFQHQFEIGLELPEASSQEQIEQQTLQVTIDEDGNFYVNEQRLVNNQTATIKRALEEAAGNDRSTPLVISADSRTPHQAVIKAMDAARQVGLTRLTFATQQPKNN